MRSLILAGGGVKVGYQAGVLQVLLDEMGLQFDHVDAASGGCFNAAMLANGMSGTEIADQWRTMDPNAFTTLNAGEYYKLVWAHSIGTHDGLIRIFRDIWKLDFRDKIRTATDRLYTFNHFNFTEKRVVVVPNSNMDEQLLLASVSLIMWLPPVCINGNNLFDAVYCTDGNVGEAVRLGADEIWAIWTVADTPELRAGFLAQYFHIIETVANGNFKREWSEIRAVNEAIERHGADASRASTDLQLREGFAAGPDLLPPPGRKHIEQHLIQQEVPVHYVLNASRDRMAAAVEMGVRDARAYAQRAGLAPVSPLVSVPLPAPEPVAVSFTETMRGFFMPGEADPVNGEREGRRNGNALDVRLTIEATDLDAFLRDPDHRATVVGTVDCPFLSASLMPVRSGEFQQFVNDRTNDITVPGHKRMLYTLTFGAGSMTFVLRGEKRLRNTPPHALWPDTTTLYTALEVSAPGRDAAPYGAGILHVLPLDFMEELTTFRVTGATDAFAAVAALARFGQFFLGQAWDVYARKIIDYAPF
jgi:predicted acylesterase/phospholipase RssA